MNFVQSFTTLALFLLMLTGCANFSKTLANKQSQPDIEESMYGRKLVLIMGCNDCHMPDGISGHYGPEENWLTGNDLGFKGSYGTLYPTNLRLLINEISVDEWVSLAQKMRQESPMAWSRLPHLETRDLRAIYSYIKYLGPKGVPAPENLKPGIQPKTKYIPFPLPH